MNVLEAKIVLRCRNTKQARNIWLDFRNTGQNYSYNYIVNKCSQLASLDYLVKRESNHGSERGRKTFYTATSDAIVEAMKVFENKAKSEKTSLQVIGGNNIANLIQFTT